MFSRIIAAVTLLLFFILQSAISSQAQERLFVEHPKNCFSIGWKTSAFTNFNNIPTILRNISQTTQFVTRYDVYCIGDELSIDSPIYTNGGNLFILARKLTINSNIDTRVYRPYKFEDFFVNPDEKDLHYAELGFPEFYSILTITDRHWGPYTTKVREKFEQYYRCVDCRQALSGQTLEHDPKLMLIPRLPDGVSPPMHQVTNQTLWGISPPADLTDFDTFKSGSINIYAGSLIVRSNPRGPNLNVGGIAGGLGGAGAPANCIGRWEQPSNFSCLTSDIAGLSAWGSRGGDAGNIYMVTADSVETTRAQAVNANFQGGLGATGKQFKSPIDTTPEPNFILVGETAHKPNGKDGNLVVSHAEVSELFPRFIALVYARARFLTYDFAELASRAQIDKSIAWSDPTEYISTMADNDVRRIFGEYSEQTRLAKNLNVEQPSSSDVPNSIFCPARSETWFSDELTLFLAILRETCGTNDQHLSVAQYLFNSGGVGAIKDQNVNSTLDRVIVRTELSENSDIWGQIIVALNTLNGRVLELYRSVETARLEASADRLQTRLRDLQARREAAERANGSIVQIFGAALEMAGPLGEFSKTFDLLIRGQTIDKDNRSRPATNDEQLEQLGSLGKGAGKLYESFSKFNALAAGQTSHRDGSEDELRNEMAKIFDAVRELADVTSGRRLNDEHEVSRAMQSNLLARTRYGKRARSGLNMFDDLARLVFLNNISPGQISATIDQNIASLNLFVTDFPTGVFQFNFSTIAGPCLESRLIHLGDYVRNKEDCVYFDAIDRNVILYARYRNDPRHLSIPMYKIIAGSGREYLRLYNFNEYKLATY